MKGIMSRLIEDEIKIKSNGEIVYECRISQRAHDKLLHVLRQFKHKDFISNDNKKIDKFRGYRVVIDDTLVGEGYVLKTKKDIRLCEEHVNMMEWFKLILYFTMMGMNKIIIVITMRMAKMALRAHLYFSLKQINCYKEYMKWGNKKNVKKG